MLIKTPPLSTKSVNVFGALFKAQLPDTLNSIRQAIPDWVAVHVQTDLAKRGPTKEEIRDELLRSLRPLAMLFDPIYTLTSPQTPPNTIATYVPDRVKPSFAPEYEHWKFIYYKESRAQLKQLFDKALGGMPDGNVGVGDALAKGQIRGQAVLEGWTGSMAIPAFKRTLEALVNPEGRVMFWDTAFGFDMSGVRFLTQAEFILGTFGAKDDRLYFDASDFSWFIAINTGGQMRVGMLS